MKRLLFGAMALAFANCSYAQKDLAEKYAKVITEADAKKQLTIIASDDFEGRETGQPGAEKAANYLMGEYKKLGLLPANKGSYFLDVPLSGITAKVNSFAVNGQSLEIGKDFSATGITADGSINTAEVAFIGYATEADLSNADLKGKVVLFINEDKTPVAGEAPRQMLARRQLIIKAIQAKSPALILAYNATARLRGAAGERIVIKKENTAASPAAAAVFTLTASATDALLQNSGKTITQLKESAQAAQLKATVAASYQLITRDAKAVDIVSYIPGSDPKLKNEVLVFSAHYDHIGLTTSGTDKVNNGADDDGSGTTGILEIARAFMQAKKDGHGPRRTILFLSNVGEEKGLLGSEYYTDHPVFPLANTIADLNIDMIGRTGYEYQKKADSSNYVYVIGSSMLSSTLHTITEEVNTKYTKLDLDYKYDDLNDPNRFYYRSDHYNFAKHGVPIIFYFDGEHQDYHKPGDEVSKINFPMLVKRAQLVFYTGWNLANRDQRPVVDAPNAPKQ